MARSPQLENGYTKIANEIIDALTVMCPGHAEGQLLFCILRKTYGWNKKADAISVSQLQEGTGLARRTVIYALQNLEAKRMILVQRNGTRPHVISFNKNYDEWLVQNFAPQVKANRERNNRASAKLCTGAKIGTSTREENDKTLHPQKKEEERKKKKEMSFEDFVETLREEYPDVDIDDELVKFNLYWDDDKRTLKKPKLAFRNWVQNSRRFYKPRTSAQAGDPNDPEEYYRRYSHYLPQKWRFACTECGITETVERKGKPAERQECPECHTPTFMCQGEASGETV